MRPDLNSACQSDWSLITDTLGYSGLMDQGRIMQRAEGLTYTTTVANAGQLWQGSNFTGGSSGGPWVVNFSGRNASLPNGRKDNYSSQFRQNSACSNASY